MLWLSRNQVLSKLWGVRLWDIKSSSCSCPQCQGRFSQRCFCMNPLCHVKQAALTIPLFEEPFWISLLAGSKSLGISSSNMYTPKSPEQRCVVDVRWCTILIYTSKLHHKCRERQWKISKDLKQNSKSIRQWLPWAITTEVPSPGTAFVPRPWLGRIARPKIGRVLRAHAGGTRFARQMVPKLQWKPLETARKGDPYGFRRKHL